MDIKKMRACAPLLPPPGEEVVLECLDELETLHARIAELERETAGNHVLIAEQNKLAKERQEWALHTSEIIRSKNAELAARDLVIKQMRDALEAMVEMYGPRGGAIVFDGPVPMAVEAIALQPSTDALDIYVAERMSGDDVPTEDDMANLIQASENFEDDGETSVEYASLLRLARLGLLDCTHFEVNADGRAAIDASLATGEQNV